jgi:MFS family permease
VNHSTAPDTDGGVATAANPLDGLPVPPRQWLMILVCLLLNLADGFDVLAMSYAAPSIAAEWSVRPDALGVVFSAALAGMTLGSMFLAGLADVYGRRRVVIAAALSMSLAMLATAFAQNVWQLGVLRLITGLGIGVLIPASAAMATEFAPRVYRNAAVVLVAAGFSFGAVSAGFLSTILIEAFGWRAVFVSGALLTAALALIGVGLLRESLQFIVARPLPDAERLAWTNRVLVSLGRPPLARLQNPMPMAAPRASTGVFTLLRPPLRTRTLLLWTLFFSYMWSSYLLSNWIPSLFVHAGYSRAEGIVALTWWTTGALIGALALGAAAIRWTMQTLAGGMLLAAAILAAAWVGIHDLPLLAQQVLIGLNGFMLSAIYGVYPIVTSAYPVEVRTAATGWCIDVGRVGAILSPMVTGVLVAQGWPLEWLILTLLVPTLLLTAALVMSSTRLAEPVT